MAENQLREGPMGLYDADEQEARRRRARRGKKAPRAKVRYWRLVPSVDVLPAETKQLPAIFLIRSALVVAIGLLALLAGARYLDWKDFDDRSQTVQIRATSVSRQLTTRQEEIEPLQSQINLQNLEIESAEIIYGLATAGQADWFTAMSGLFAISVGGVEFLSATVNFDGRIELIGAATSSDAIASLPTQLSQLAGVVNLQGIQWDAAASPPIFTAEFQINR